MRLVKVYFAENGEEKKVDVPDRITVRRDRVRELVVAGSIAGVLRRWLVNHRTSPVIRAYAAAGRNRAKE